MPKIILFNFFRLFIFLFLLFDFGRIIFLLFHYDHLSGIPFGEIIACFWNSLSLDLSTACYLLTIPFLLMVINSFHPRPFFNRITRYYLYLLIFIYAVIISSEMALYHEWGTKLNYKSLTYLQHPSEVLRTASWSVGLLSLLFIAIQTFAGVYCFRKYFNLKDVPVKGNKLFALLLFLIFTPLLFIGLRGGMKKIPINQSASYYSTHDILNLTAVNSGWNLVHSIVHNIQSLHGNLYNFYSLHDAKRMVNQIYTYEKDTTEMILTTQRPNVVLIILEGWSADLVKPAGGYDSLTPEFNKLCEEGILFTKMYAVGDRSEQGMAGILSSFPAQPVTSIIKDPEKSIKLPALNYEFSKMNYKSSYLFGGQLRYGNIKGYLLNHHFDKVTEESDFANNIPRGGLGVHDEFMFTKLLADQRLMSSPFFSVAFTLSSHAPYDYPWKKTFSWGGDENKYINGVHYSDHYLGKYFEEAKKTPWFNNTLFVIIADHSHNSPKEYNFNEPAYKRIPMLLYGNVLKQEYRGTTYKKICSQLDLSATLLTQLGAKRDRYHWSKNLFNPYCPEFAYFEFEDGFGWIRPEGYIVYNASQDRIIFKRLDHPDLENRLLTEGKSYLEILFQEYLDY